MKKAHVQHMDMDAAGKNMLINQDRLILYDFDIAEIDGSQLNTSYIHRCHVNSRDNNPYQSIQLVAHLHVKSCKEANQGIQMKSEIERCIGQRIPYNICKDRHLGLGGCAGANTFCGHFE